jgi:Zn-dependent protease/CBS domain-containing protein
MRWSWKIGNFAGISVFMHATFLILIGWVALSHWLVGRTPGAVITGVAFILALFLCVVLHEYGHALMARRYGIRTRDITLLPIGGVARLERMPDKPEQELLVALAGPAVNVVIAGVLFVWLSVTGSWMPMREIGLTAGSFVERLMIVNLFLVGFNMLPAFPMDGGRVLRALLAKRMEYTRATQIAAGLGQGMAFLFGFAGLFYNPFLLFIAFFVWIGAAQEASMAQMRSALAGVPVSRAMLTEYRTLNATDPLARAVDAVLRGSQADFPVMDGKRIAGVLTRGDLLKALAEHHENTMVRDVMTREFEMVDEHEMLEPAFQRMQASAVHIAPVTRFGCIVGILTVENVGELLMIQAAIEGARAKLKFVKAAA